jgi:hypothetical protein
MRSKTCICVMLALFGSAVLDAGQIYGTIVSEGKGLASANVEIKCGAADAVTGSTAADGAYRINVSQQGQCTLTLPGVSGRPSTAIFSSPNPTLYNFDLVKLGDGKFELRRR